MFLRFRIPNALMSLSQTSSVASSDNIDDMMLQFEGREEGKCVEKKINIFCLHDTDRIAPILHRTC